MNPTPPLPTDDQDDLPAKDTPGEKLVKLRLVPVEVFGAGRCTNGHTSDADGNDPTLCSVCGQNVEGYGLMDAVSSWSDCNRAIGKIYRVDDLEHRNEGETVEILVREEDLPFFKKRWGDE